MNLKINIFWVENKYLSLDRNRCWRLEFKPKIQNFWNYDELIFCQNGIFCQKKTSVRSILVTYVWDEICWWQLEEVGCRFCHQIVSHLWKLSPILSRMSLATDSSSSFSHCNFVSYFNETQPKYENFTQTKPNLSSTSLQILFYLI